MVTNSNMDNSMGKIPFIHKSYIKKKVIKVIYDEELNLK